MQVSTAATSARICLHVGSRGLIAQRKQWRNYKESPLFFSVTKIEFLCFQQIRKTKKATCFFFLFFLSPLCSRPVYSSATQTWCVLYKWIMYTTGCHIVQKWSRLANEAWNSLLETEAKLAAPVNVGSVFFQFPLAISRDAMFCIDLYPGCQHSDVLLGGGEVAAKRQQRGEEVLQHPSGADIYFGLDS